MTCSTANGLQSSLSKGTEGVLPVGRVRRRQSSSSSSSASSSAPLQTGTREDFSPAASSTQQEAQSAVSSTRTSAAAAPISTSKADVRREFKKLVRSYMKNHTPPSDEQMETIPGLRGQFDWEDVITRQQEVGLKKGIIYEETGDMSFDEWPTAPHEPLILEFTKMFLQQFDTPWVNSPLYPIFEGEGSQGSIPRTFFRTVS